MSAIQSSTCVSNSVHAGLVAHSIPCTPKPAESSSPKMLGPEVLAGKYAKKFGDCQCVIPGKINRSTSDKIFSNDSPCRGGWAGRERRISPGFTFEKYWQRFYGRLIVRNPVHNLVAPFAEIFGAHVKGFDLFHRMRG